MTIDRNQMRARLERERSRIRRELGDIQAHEQSLRAAAPTDSVGYTNHFADEASDYFEQEKDRTLIGNLQRLAEQIDLALRKLDLGTYGICEQCGEPIDPERLEALPWATTCLRCRAQLERAYVQEYQ